MNLSKSQLNTIWNKMRPPLWWMPLLFSSVFLWVIALFTHSLSTLYFLLSLGITLLIITYIRRSPSQALRHFLDHTSPRLRKGKVSFLRQFRLNQVLVGLELETGQRGLFIWIRGMLDQRTLQLGTSLEFWENSEGILLLKEPLRGLGMGQLYDDRQRPSESHQFTLAEKPETLILKLKLVFVFGLMIVLGLGCMVPFFEFLEQFEARKQEISFIILVPLGFFSFLSGGTLIYMTIKPIFTFFFPKKPHPKLDCSPSPSPYWAQVIDMQNVEGSITYRYLVWVNQHVFLGQAEGRNKASINYKSGDWMPILIKDSMGIAVDEISVGTHRLQGEELGDPYSSHVD